MCCLKFCHGLLGKICAHPVPLGGCFCWLMQQNASLQRPLRREALCHLPVQLPALHKMHLLMCHYPMQLIALHDIAFCHVTFLCNCRLYTNMHQLMWPYIQADLQRVKLVMQRIALQAARSTRIERVQPHALSAMLCVDIRRYAGIYAVHWTYWLAVHTPWPGTWSCTHEQQVECWACTMADSHMTDSTACGKETAADREQFKDTLLRGWISRVWSMSLKSGMPFVA